MYLGFKQRDRISLHNRGLRSIQSPKEMSADLSRLSTRAVAWYDNRIGTKRTARKKHNLNMAEVNCQGSRANDQLLWRAAEEQHSSFLLL